MSLTLIRALPAVRVARHPRAEPLRLDRLQVAVGVRRLPRAVRPLQGDLMTTTTETPGRHRRTPSSTRCGSRSSTGSPTTRWRSPSTCPTSCATTTTSPRASTSRSALELDGDDVRRNYSICAPAGVGGAAGRGQAAARRGLLRATRIDVLQVGDVARRDDPDRAVHHPARPDVGAALRRDRGRQRHHAGALDRRDRAGRASRQLAGARCSTATARSRSVMFLEELGRPQGPLPRAAPRSCTCCRASRRRSSCSPAGSTPRGSSGCSTRSCRPTTVDEWFLCGPFEMVEPGCDGCWSPRASRRAPCTPSCSTSRASRPAPHARRGRACAERRGDDHARRPGQSTFTLPSDGPAVLDAALRGPHRRAVTPARAGSAAPAGAGSSRARWRWTRNYALEPDEVERGYVLTCQSHPTSERLVLDFDA